MQAHPISALALVEATFVTPSAQLVDSHPFLQLAEACCSLRERSRNGPVFQVPHQGDCGHLQLPTGFHESEAGRPD